MNDSTRNNLHLALAAIQAFGATLSSLPLLGVKAEFLRVVGWIAILMTFMALAILTYSYRRGATRAAAASELTSSDDAAVRESPQPRSEGYVIHRMVVFTLWSIIVSSVVICQTTHMTGALLVGLGPLWISGGAFVATRIARGHRFSAILLAGLFCGSAGAFLGSGGLQFGFVWGCLTGGLAAGYFFDGNPYMSLWGGIVSTLVFVGAMFLIIRLPSSAYDVSILGSCAQVGLPLLFLEATWLLVAYLAVYSSNSLARLLRTDRQKPRRSTRRPKGNQSGHK
jgi:hypothetical protein